MIMNGNVTITEIIVNFWKLNANNWFMIRINIYDQQTVDNIYRSAGGSG